MRYQHETIAVVCSDRTTAIVADTDVGGLILPWGFTLLDVQGSLVTAAASGTFTVDVHANGTSVLSTKLTFDATETSSLTDASQPVFVDRKKMVALERGDSVTIDVDDDASGDATGLIVYLVGMRHF